MTPIQTTLTTALQHWFGDAQGQGAVIFAGVDLATFRAVRAHPAVHQAEASVLAASLTGNVRATVAACHALTIVYKRALQQCQQGLPWTPSREVAA